MGKLTKKSTKIAVRSCLAFFLVAMLVLSGVGIYAFFHKKEDGATPENPLAWSIDAWDGKTVSAADFVSDFGGRGDKTITIDSAESFVYFVEEVNKGVDYAGHTIYLNSNIDLGGYRIDSIGNEDHPFRGTFDGGYYTIYNASIKGNGLFGHTERAVIKNIGLYGCTIKGAGEYVGGLIGTAVNTDVYDSFVRLGSVKGENYVAGLVGKVVSTNSVHHYISQSFADTALEGEVVGGLVGELYSNDSTYSKLNMSYSYFTGAEKAIAKAEEKYYSADKIIASPRSSAEFVFWDTYDAEYKNGDTWCDYSFRAYSDELDFRFPILSRFNKVYNTGSYYENVLVVDGEAQDSASLSDAITTADSSASSEIRLLVDKVYLEERAEIENTTLTISAVKNTTIVRGESNEDSLIVSKGTSTLILGDESNKELILDGNSDYVESKDISSGALVVATGHDFVMNKNVTIQNNINNMTDYGGGLLVYDLDVDDVTIRGTVQHCQGKNGGGVAVIMPKATIQMKILNNIGTGLYLDTKMDAPAEQTFSSLYGTPRVARPMADAPGLSASGNYTLSDGTTVDDNDYTYGTGGVYCSGNLTFFPDSKGISVSGNRSHYGTGGISAKYIDLDPEVEMFYAGSSWIHIDNNVTTGGSSSADCVAAIYSNSSISLHNVLFSISGNTYGESSSSPYYNRSGAIVYCGESLGLKGFTMGGENSLIQNNYVYQSGENAFNGCVSAIYANSGIGRLETIDISNNVVGGNCDGGSYSAATMFEIGSETFGQVTVCDITLSENSCLPYSSYADFYIPQQGAIVDGGIMNSTTRFSVYKAGVMPTTCVDGGDTDPDSASTIANIDTSSYDWWSDCLITLVSENGYTAQPIRTKGTNYILAVDSSGGGGSGGSSSGGNQYELYLPEHYTYADGVLTGVSDAGFAYMNEQLGTSYSSLSDCYSETLDIYIPNISGVNTISEFLSSVYNADHVIIESNYTTINGVPYYIEYLEVQGGTDPDNAPSIHSSANVTNLVTLGYYYSLVGEIYVSNAADGNSSGFTFTIDGTAFNYEYENGTTEYVYYGRNWYESGGGPLYLRWKYGKWTNWSSYAHPTGNWMDATSDLITEWSDADSAEGGFAVEIPYTIKENIYILWLPEHYTWSAWDVTGISDEGYSLLGVSPGETVYRGGTIYVPAYSTERGEFPEGQGHIASEAFSCFSEIENIYIEEGFVSIGDEVNSSFLHKISFPSTMKTFGSYVVTRTNCIEFRGTGLTADGYSIGGPLAEYTGSSNGSSYPLVALFEDHASAEALGEFIANKCSTGAIIAHPIDVVFHHSDGTTETITTVTFDGAINENNDIRRRYIDLGRDYDYSYSSSGVMFELPTEVSGKEWDLSAYGNYTGDEAGMNLGEYLYHASSSGHTGDELHIYALPDYDLYLPEHFTYSGATLTGISDAGKAILTAKGSGAVVSIPSANADGVTTTTIGGSAFKSQTAIGEVIIPEGITSIGTYLFQKCTGLTSVEIPSSITTIPNYMFNGCTALTNYSIPSHITSIGWSAFSGCTSLASITIPSSVTNIGLSAFNGCASLTSITIPSSVTSIGTYVFQGCTSLTSANLQYKATSISDGMFDKCGALTSVTIPSSITSIGQYAFRNCSSLTNITIPSSVTSIGTYAFQGCTSLASANLQCKATYIPEYMFDGCTALTDVTMQSSITSINAYAFQGCTSLTSITIPSGVTSIKIRAFANCTALTSITIPSSVTSIGLVIFVSCTNLTNIIAENQTYYNTYNTSGHALYTYSSKLTYPISLKYQYLNGTTTTEYHLYKRAIGWTKGNDGKWALNSSYALPTLSSGLWLCNGEIISTTSQLNTLFTSGTITEDIVLTEASADLYLPEHFTYDGATITGISDAGQAIVDAKSTYAMIIPRVNTSGTKVTAIAGSAFKDDTKLSSVFITNTIISTGAYCFKGCTSLTHVDIAPSIGSLGNDCFDGSGLTSMNYLGTFAQWLDIIFNVGASPTYQTKKLTIQGVDIVGNVVIPDGATKVAGLSNCTGITSITISSSVTTISGYALDGCTGITSINIPEGVTVIGTAAFLDCSNLQSVIIPSTIEAGGINQRAFSGCTSLASMNYLGTLAQWCEIIGDTNTYTTNPTYYTKKLTINGEDIVGDIAIPNTVASISDYTFYNCLGITSVAIPSSVTTFGYAVFTGCSDLTTIIAETKDLYTTYTTSGHALYSYASKLTYPVTVNFNHADGSVTTEYHLYNRDAGWVKNSDGTWSYNSSYALPTEVGPWTDADGNEVDVAKLTEMLAVSGVTVIELSSVKAIETVPTVSGTYTYSGSTQTPTWSNYDSTQLTIGGTYSAINAGTYTATFTPKDGYQWSDGTTTAKSVQWTIAKANITPVVSMAGYAYAGTVSTPSISGNTGNGAVTYYYNTTNSTTGGTEWKNITSTTLNAGKYYIYAVVAESDNYNGATTATVSFTVSEGTIDYTATGVNATYDDTNTPYSITVNTTTNGAVITYSTSASGTYSATNPTYTDAGTYTTYFKITAANYTTIEGSETVTIAKCTGTLTFESDTVTYDGSTHSITAAGHGGTIYYATSETGAYTTTAPTFTVAGTHTVWAKLVGDKNHTDVAAKSATLTINAYTLTSGMITLGTTSYTYDGTAKTPSVTVTFNSNALTLDTDYTVSYSANTNVGTAKVTISGKGNFTGSVEKSFTISKATLATPVVADLEVDGWDSLATAKWSAISGIGNANVTYTVVLYRGTTAISTKTGLTATTYDFSTEVRAQANSYYFTVQAISSDTNNVNSGTAAESSKLYSTAISTSGDNGIASAEINGATSYIMIAGESNISIEAVLNSGYSFGGWVSGHASLTVSATDNLATTVALSRTTTQTSITLQASTGVVNKIITINTSNTLAGNTQKVMVYDSTGTNLIGEYTSTFEIFSGESYVIKAYSTLVSDDTNYIYQTLTVSGGTTELNASSPTDTVLEGVVYTGVVNTNMTITFAYTTRAMNTITIETTGTNGNTYNVMAQGITTPSGTTSFKVISGETYAIKFTADIISSGNATQILNVYIDGTLSDNWKNITASVTNRTIVASSVITADKTIKLEYVSAYTTEVEVPTTDITGATVSNTGATTNSSGAHVVPDESGNLELTIDTTPSSQTTEKTYVFLGFTYTIDGQTYNAGYQGDENISTPTFNQNTQYDDWTGEYTYTVDSSVEKITVNVTEYISVALDADAWSDSGVSQLTFASSDGRSKTVEFGATTIGLYSGDWTISTVAGESIDIDNLSALLPAEYTVEDNGDGTFALTIS
ncbi:MAG: hypothetical protein E7351_00825 [Clostridiales bacterium]|nr:hypothetical protein [Clostridiales bacterium]